MKRLLIILCMVTAGLVNAQPIEFIVKSAVGGPDDIMTRKLADEIEKKSALKVIVVNKPGAAHIIGYNYFESKTTPSLIIADDNMQKHSVYLQSEKLANLGDFTNIIYVKKDSGISTFKELTELSKRRVINFGHGGEGTYSHIAASKICEKALNCLLVPYKSGAPAMIDMLVGTIDAYSLISYGADIYMNNNNYTAIMMYSNTKHPKYDIPRLPSTLRNLEIRNWIALFSRNISDKDKLTIKNIMSQLDINFYTDAGLWYNK